MTPHYTYRQPLTCGCLFAYLFLAPVNGSANDDQAKSIGVVLDAMCAAINEGLEERRIEKEKEAEEAPKEVEKKPRTRKTVKVEVEAPTAAEAEVEAPATEEAAE